MKKRVVQPVTASELMFAMRVGDGAASGRIPQSGVGGMGIDYQEDDQVRRLELTDIPENRAMIAIRDQFPGGKFQPIMLRLWALWAMLKRDEAKPFIRPAQDGDGEEISEALFEIAATMPLNAKLLFNANTFFKRVAAIHTDD